MVMQNGALLHLFFFLLLLLLLLLVVLVQVVLSLLLLLLLLPILLLLFLLPLLLVLPSLLLLMLQLHGFHGLRHQLQLGRHLICPTTAATAAAVATATAAIASQQQSILANGAASRSRERARVHDSRGQRTADGRQRSAHASNAMAAGKGFMIAGFMIALMAAAAAAARLAQPAGCGEIMGASRHSLQEVHDPTGAALGGRQRGGARHGGSCAALSCGALAVNDAAMTAGREGRCVLHRGVTGIASCACWRAPASVALLLSPPPPISCLGARL